VLCGEYLWILSSTGSELKKDIICLELFSRGNSFEIPELTPRKLVNFELSSFQNYNRNEICSLISLDLIFSSFWHSARLISVGILTALCFVRLKSTT
jgi:hypothetical protein